MENSKITISVAQSPSDLEAVRGLVRIFHNWAMTEVSPGADPETFKGLEKELADLPGKYGPPAGCLLLARLDDEAVGCVAFYPKSETTMEVKRMYVLPPARGHHIGSIMLKRLLGEAGRLGYRKYVLSSHKSMHAAHAIYRKAGFNEVPVWPNFPSADRDMAICMEMIP